MDCGGARVARAPNSAWDQGVTPSLCTLGDVGIENITTDAKRYC
jgi:hypothetical protein